MLKPGGKFRFTPLFDRKRIDKIDRIAKDTGMPIKRTNWCQHGFSDGIYAVELTKSE